MHIRFPSRPPSLTELAAAKEKSDLLRQQGEQSRHTLFYLSTVNNIDNLLCYLHFYMNKGNKKKNSKAFARDL